MTVTLKQIEFYEAVCQAGNVTAAAQQLYVSRSVISRAIQELEDELDIQLFVRGRNGMELTEYGKTLRNLLSQFKGFYSALLAQISSLKETGENHSLTVGLAISCWNVFPLEIYEALKKRHPHIKLSVLEISSYDAIKKLNDGSIDIVLTPLDIKERFNTMESIDIYPTANIFCTSLNDPLAQQDSVTFLDIRQRPIAVLNSKLPVDWPLQIRLCTNTSSLIREAVSKGILCALLPQDFVRDWDDVAVLPFNPPQNCAVKAVWNKNLPHSSALQEFVDFLLEYFAAQGIVLPEEKIEDDEI